MSLPSHDYLDHLRIPYEKLSFPGETDKGAASVADALGYKQGQMVKTLIFESSSDERVLVMLGGDKNAISGKLKRAISSGPHHQDSGEAKIRESTAGVSRKPSSDGKARGCSSKHLWGLTAWNT